MTRTNERGVALILTMILLVVLSLMAASLLFLARTETWSSSNYQLMSQARYGAEAGMNSAANYLMYSYSGPGTGADQIGAYNMTVSPVTYNGNPVVLSAISSVASNYPIAGTQTAFNTASHGSLMSNVTNVAYAASATLLYMRQITPYGSATPITIQTWQITSDGNITGIRNSQVEVSAILERQYFPIFSYAVFADANGCSALQFGGGGTTNSYDSSTAKNGAVATQAYGGNVGTNGNLATNGNPTTINGSLSTPRQGVGACSVNNVTAWTDNNGTVTGGIVELPQPVTYPTPTIPPPGSQDLNMTKNWSCPSGANAIPGCANNGGEITIPPGSYGNISMQGGANMHVSTGVYNINSISEAGQATVVVDSGPVVINVTGNGFAAGSTVIKLTGGSVTNASLNPMNLQFLYAGPASISLKGWGQASGLIYAPNASFSFGGGGDWYGALVGQTMSDMGGAAIHYDRRLQNNGFSAGNYMLESFTWKKF